MCGVWCLHLHRESSFSVFSCSTLKVLDLIIGIFCGTLTLFALHTLSHMRGSYFRSLQIQNATKFWTNDAADCFYWDVWILCEIMSACVRCMCQNQSKIPFKILRMKRTILLFALKADLKRRNAIPFIKVTHNIIIGHRRRHRHLHYCTTGMLARNPKSHPNNASICVTANGSISFRLFLSLCCVPFFVSERSERID